MITKLDKLQQARSELAQRQRNCAALRELIAECDELTAVIPSDRGNLATIHERNYITQRRRELVALLKDETNAVQWLENGGDTTTDTANEIAAKLGLA